MTTSMFLFIHVGNKCSKEMKEIMLIIILKVNFYVDYLKGFIFKLEWVKYPITYICQKHENYDLFINLCLEWDKVSFGTKGQQFASYNENIML